VSRNATKNFRLQLLRDVSCSTPSALVRPSPNNIDIHPTDEPQRTHQPVVKNMTHESRGRQGLRDCCSMSRIIAGGA